MTSTSTSTSTSAHDQEQQRRQRRPLTPKLTYVKAEAEAKHTAAVRTAEENFMIKLRTIKKKDYDPIVLP
jgi:hypothetical protein